MTYFHIYQVEVDRLNTLAPSHAQDQSKLSKQAYNRHMSDCASCLSHHLNLLTKGSRIASYSYTILTQFCKIYSTPNLWWFLLKVLWRCRECWKPEELHSIKALVSNARIPQHHLLAPKCLIGLWPKTLWWTILITAESSKVTHRITQFPSCSLTSFSWVPPQRMRQHFCWNCSWLQLVGYWYLLPSYTR